MSLDTHEGSGRDGVYSEHNTPLDAESSRSSGNPEHYDTLIYDASPTLPSESPMLEAPHMPFLIPGSLISAPSSDVGLGRAVRATHTLSSQCHRAVHNSYCLLKMVVLR